MRFLKPNKVLIIYALVLILSSLFSSTKSSLDPIADVVECDLDNTPNCSIIFDGYICWDEMDHSFKYVIGSDIGSYKKCKKHVRRFRLHEDEEGISEYNTAKEDVGFRRAVNITHLIGSCISAIALIFYIIIFMCLETTPIVKIDVNLFVALLLNNCSCITLYYFVVSDAAVIAKNEVWCRALHCINSYFMSASYTWILSKIFKIHLCVVMIQDNTPFRMFALFGWGVPALITGFYMASRTYLEPTKRCWIDRGNSTWILIVPIYITLLVAFGFLINAIRVLIDKLHRAQSVQSSLTTRKIARAALLMVPVFGFHFTLVPFRPSPNTTADKVYEIILTLLTSLQGACISTFMCCNNREVVGLLRTRVNRIREVFGLAVVEEEPNPANTAPEIELV